jgi:hypothetical protein
MEKEERFDYRSYTKTELALMYSPDSTPATALQCLTRWMKQCRPLMAELASMGYNKFRHTLFRQEVEAIVKHLGEP